MRGTFFFAFPENFVHVVPYNPTEPDFRFLHSQTAIKVTVVVCYHSVDLITQGSMPCPNFRVFCHGVLVIVIAVY